MHFPAFETRSNTIYHEFSWPTMSDSRNKLNVLEILYSVSCNKGNVDKREETQILKTYIYVTSMLKRCTNDIHISKKKNLLYFETFFIS